MKIAIWHNLPSGGGKRALYEQVRGLVGRGHHVEAWRPTTADSTYLPLGDLIREHEVPFTPAGPSALDRLVRFPPRVRGSLLAMEEHCRQCAEEIGRGDFDILFAHSCTLFRATPIARFVSLPTVLYQQEPYRWLYEAMPRLPWIGLKPSKHSPWSLRRIRERWLELRILFNSRRQARDELMNASAFDRILVNSLFSRESIIRAYGLDAEVCYLGIDLDKFQDRGLARENTVVGLGAFTPEKNVALAIEAIALMPEPRPALEWIGNIAYGGFVEAMAELAAKRSVTFVPRIAVSDEEIVALLNRASAMIYAPRLEPFGLAPIEGGACGLPIVAVAEGGVRETVINGETGLLVAHNAHAVADALISLFDDPALARRLGRGGRRNAELRWSNDGATHRIEKALKRVVASSAPN